MIDLINEDDNFTEILAGFERLVHARTIYFFNKAHPKGGVTVCYFPLLSNRKGYPQGDYALVSAAYCHPNDTYSRKKGKRIALTNLWNNENSMKLPIYVAGHPVHYLRSMFWYYA